MSRAGAHSCGDCDFGGKLSRHPDLIDCLYLVKHGVPFDVAFSLPDDERLAFVVVLGTLNGGLFNWETLRWQEPI